MATMSYPQSARKPTGMLLLVGLLLVGLFAVVVAPQLQISAHAVAKHGTDAQVAVSWLHQAGQTHKWQCPDGREHWADQMNDGKTWALMVVLQDRVITAFLTTSQGYVQSFLEGCKNPWHYAH